MSDTKKRDIRQLRESIMLQERTHRNLKALSIECGDSIALSERILAQLKAQLWILNPLATDSVMHKQH